MDAPRVVVAGVRSKVGKTMVSLGLMRCIAERGYTVQPFKVGPDFIDPGFHYFATRRKSRNLDSFMLSKRSLLEVFCRGMRGADIAVIEGKTGLYDSADAIGERGSVAEVSKILKAPVILVADAERMNRSLAALVLGYKMFDRDVDLRAAILNRVGSDRHAARVSEAVRRLAKLPVLGCIPRYSISMPYRHLGLVTAYERSDIDELIDQVAEIVERHVDVDAVIDIAFSAPPLEDVRVERGAEKIARIGVVRDIVFSFYYVENIEELSRFAEIVYIDSLRDRRLPNVDALYIGGGFPEVFAEELEKNRRLRERIYEFCDSGKPVYAECGGLMFLGKTLEVDGCEYEMVGFLPLKTTMCERFQAQGYCIYRSLRDTPVSVRNEIVVGHEFHYSKPEVLEDANFAFAVKRGFGIDGKRDGIMVKNTLACYIHMHFLSNCNAARRFAQLAKKIGERERV